ncbi:MAG: M28 family metallopeptidase [Candidatus Sericytochromatia bacterium]
MSRFLLPASLTILILAGCATGALLRPNPANPLRAQNAVNAPRVEQGVSLERMQALAAVLTGQAKLPDGRVIPERGSVAGRALTRQFISQTLESYGYKVEPHTYRNNGINITARLLAPTPTQEYLIVGAHMDSVSNAGADDNNTGSVAVLEAARLLKDLPDRQVNILFAWFDEEELGLIGSRALARDLKKQGMKVLSVHTLDMVGWDSDHDKVIEIEQPDANLWDYYQQVNQSHGLKLPLIRTSSGDTDHVAFRSEGFTSVGLCEEWVGGDTTPYYHRRSDTYNTIDFDYASAVTRLMVAAVGDLSRKVKGPVVTSLIPHNRFPSRPRPFHSATEAHPLD